MSYVYLYQAMFLATIMISIWAAAAIWRRRHAPGGLALFLMMLAILEWNFSGLMQVSTKNMGEMILWSKIGYLGGMAGQMLFFIFVLEYTHQQKWLTRRNIALLFIMPALTFLLAATNEQHLLIWSGFSPSPDGVNLIYHHGIWFWVIVVYINSILFIGAFLLFRFILRSRELHRAQNIGLMVASLFPWAGFIVYSSGVNPFPGMDLIAISFAFTGIVLVYIISRFSFLEVIPVAREFLVDYMLDGLLVLDINNRVVDINPAALDIFHVNPNLKWIGTPVRALLREYSDLEQRLGSPDKIQIEWERTLPEPHVFDVQIYPLHERFGRFIGKSVVLRDVTHLKKIERELQKTNHQLEEKLAQIERLKDELREQSIHDALTGLFNRRYLEEIFQREIARAERGNYPLSLVIIDIDHFKELNDTCGHAQGDNLLRSLGERFRTHFRIGDISCRYGGDEFVLLMPHSSAENAYRRVEAFREVCSALSREAAEGAPAVTFSAGIAAYSLHAKNTDELFCIADQALYQAKAQGRNRVCLPV